MITLATLKNATEQEVFEQSAKHLLKQNTKSVSVVYNEKTCLYKHEGLCCAAGVFISDEEYKPDIEGQGWISLVYRGKVPDEHATLILQLQTIHDSWDVENWKKKLINLAIKQKLDYSFI